MHSGGTAAADVDNDEQAEAAAGGDGNDHVTDHEHEHVNTTDNIKWLPNNQYKRIKNKLKNRQYQLFLIIPK